MRTFALIPKRSQPEAIAMAEQVATWLQARGRAVVCESGGPVEGASPVSAEELAQCADLVVVLGGDGTLLHAARLLGAREVPILGINMGTLGFMTEWTREQTFAALERILAGDFSVERRTRLAVTVTRGERLLMSSEVLNDAVINKNALARIAEVAAYVDDALLTMYKADGVIVSTPTGSSAYSLAAGGPLVHPAVSTMLVTPICPHTLTQRPLLLPDDRTVVLELCSDSEMFVTLDGQSGRAIELGDKVTVRRSPTATLLVRPASATWYAVLRDKLHWGQR